MHAPQYHLSLALRAEARRRSFRRSRGHRPGRLLGFEREGRDPEIQSVQLDPKWAERLRGLDSFVLCRAAHSVLIGGRGLLLTYVLRDSMSGLRWQDSLGQSRLLQPGTMFLRQERQDGFLELSPSRKNESCTYVQIRLQCELAESVAIQAGPNEVTFCNSTEACVRVLLGTYAKRKAGIERPSRPNLFDVDLVPRSEFEIPIGIHGPALALVTYGSLQLDGVPVESMSAISFSGVEPSALLSTRTGASLLWLEMPEAVHLT